MDCALSQERREDARFGADVLRGARATLRPGCTVTLVDLSAGGALVEAGRPLRPGARVHLQFQRGAHRYSVGAHVLRCTVWALDAEAGVMYRGALEFENRCDTLWEPEARTEYHGPELDRKEAPAEGHALPAPLRRRESERKRGRG